MIPKAQLPFLKPLPEQVKRAKMIKSRRKIYPRGKKYSAPKVLSKTQLTAQIKKFVD